MTPTKEITREELDTFLEELDNDDVAKIERWLERGDGVAVYRNEDLGHPEVGHRKFASFGSPAAQLEVDVPPKGLPDMGQAINWRYYLEAYYRRGRDDRMIDERIERRDG